MPEYDVDDQGREFHVKSKTSLCRTRIRFTNASTRPVRIFWIDFEGDATLCKCLLPKQFVDINTYTGHPWIFRDSQTRERFVVNNKRVFWSTPPPQAHSREFPNAGVVRVNWNITAPLRDLRNNCLIALAELISDEDDVSRLSLPNTLACDLRNAVGKRRCVIVE